MPALDPTTFHSALDAIFGFVGFAVEPTSESLPPTVQAARNALRRKGWTQVHAAGVLGVTPVHLSYVLNGRRESRRVLNAIAELPENPTPA